jgi:hypothetical protein
MEPNVVSEDGETKRRMLVEAGYCFQPTEDLWVNEFLDRQLDGGIEHGLTVQQLLEWIKAGGARMRTPNI